MAIEFLTSETSLFYQRTPIAEMSHLDAIALTGIALSGREAGAPYESPDVGQRGRFRIKGFLPGGLIQAGFAAQRPWREINYLWKLTREEEVNFRINAYKTGTETDVEAYKSALLFVQGVVTNPALDGGKALQSGDVARNLTGMTVQAVAGYELLPLSNAARQTSPVVYAATGIFFAEAIGSGPLRRRAGQHGVITIAAKVANGATPDVLRTIDYGATWTAATTDPAFDAGLDAIAPLMVDLPQSNQYRVIVFQGTTDAGADPLWSYYIDVVPGTVAWAAGAWTKVVIGATANEYCTASFRVHDGLLLCGTDGGNIYYSNDKGISWTASSYGSATDVRYFALGPDGRIWACGDTKEVFYSEDNGLNWTEVTTEPAGDVDGIAVNYAGDVYIIDNDTLLKRSINNGLSWTTVTVCAGVTNLYAVQFDPHGYTGIILVNDAGSDDRLYRTEDGGVTWMAITTGTANNGLRVAKLVHENLLYIAGPIETTTWIEKVFGSGEGS